jgi:hypothetical protein
MTLKALYQSVTRDTSAHQRTIAAQLTREGSRRRRLVKLYLDGLSDRQGAERTKQSHGAARSMLRHTMWALHKRIHGLPRYHRTGRARPKTAAREQLARDRAEQIQTMHVSFGPPISAREALAETSAPQKRPAGHTDRRTP